MKIASGVPAPGVQGTISAQSHAVTLPQGIDTCCSLFLVLFAQISEWPDFSTHTSLNNNDDDVDDIDDDNDGDGDDK